MGKVAKKYEELVITDDFMFGKVFRNPEHCRKLLEIILGAKIQKLVFIDNQESLNPDYQAKGIRLDVYAGDDGNTVYDVEMQTGLEDSLPRRSRYYQSVIDISLIEKGADYRDLKKSYVIFICTFDPFGMGSSVYHFENLCRDKPFLRLGDETEKIFLNTRGTVEDADGELKNLLKYFDSLVPQDAFTKELDRAVEKAKEHREWRTEYMRMTAWEQDVRAEGRAEGKLINLINQIRRKIAKGKTPEAIAEDLDEELEKVKRVYDVVSRHSPEDDIEEILRELAEEV